MDYSPDAFAALWDEIEKQSGAMLPDKCETGSAAYTDPPYIQNLGVAKNVTCGCNNESRFVILYDIEPGTPKEERNRRKAGSGYATVCAVCDSVGAYPRFCEAVYEADPDMDPMRNDEEDDE